MLKDTKILETLISSYSKYRSRSSQEQRPVIEDLLKSYSRFLFQSYQADKAQWENEFKDDFSVLLGGDKLHLSSSYREEHVSSWLKWILEAPPLDDGERVKFLSAFFSSLMNSSGYKGYSGEVPAVALSASITFRTEISLEPESRIDLLIESGGTVVLIENKIGDLSLSKNKRYLKCAGKLWPSKRIVPILVLPAESLEQFLYATPQKEADEILSAFPPATWETVLNSLRAAIKGFDDKSPLYLLWKANIYSFMSFVEGNVLGYDLGTIRRMLQKKGPPNYSEISEFSRYRRYRKGE